MKEAQPLNNKCLGSEHIFLALIGDEDGIVAKAFLRNKQGDEKIKETTHNS